jgi:hypothetical protein
MTEFSAVPAYNPYFVETFVDPTRFRATRYRAANWSRLGGNTGRGKDDHTNRPNRSIKEVLGYPLTIREWPVISWLCVMVVTENRQAPN